MENHLKLFLPLSLEELGLRKVAALFCSNSDDIKIFYQSLSSRIPICEVKQWLKATEEKMSKLGLPESLNKEVIDNIQAIGLEIREWKERNESRSIGSMAELPDISKLCYASTGAIDYKKIAEQYVHCDRLKDWQRYEIACRNCLENHIPLLWHKLSDEKKTGYKIYERSPYCFWHYILEGEHSKLDDLWRESGRDLTSFNQWAFEESARCDNQVAVEYFFQKLTPEEREVSLMRTAYNVFGNSLLYLLSLITPEQQMELVKDRPINVLYCFLDWPRRHLLPENAALIWPFIQESDYGFLLMTIYYFKLRPEKNCFPKFFQEFFKHAPPDFIKKSSEGCESDICTPACRVLCELVDTGDSESIEAMLRHADAASRVKLVSSVGVFGRFYDCILKERWDGVVACLRDSALSDEERGTVKESFMQYLDRRVSGVYAEQKIRRFFEFLHETDASDDKERKVKRLKLQ